MHIYQLVFILMLFVFEKAKRYKKKNQDLMKNVSEKKAHCLTAEKDLVF